MHKETENKIKDLLDKGCTPEHIADEMEIKVRTVLIVKKKYGPKEEIDTKKQHYPPELIAEWDKLHARYGKGGE